MAIRRILTLAGLMILAAGCATAPSRTSSSSGSGDAHYKVGKPYKVSGQWYYPAEDPTYDKRGVASWYGDAFHGKKTANGETFDMRRMTAAHTTLPLPSMVEVTNLDNGRRAVVRVNDRGPFASNRIIDMSREAARALGFEKQGLAHVRVRYLGPATLPGQAKPQYAQKQPSQPTTPPRRERAAQIQPLLEVPGAEDGLGAIIAGADIDRDPVLPPPASAYEIEVVLLSDLADVPHLRERLAGEGPLRIVKTDSGAPAPLYQINLGPYSNELEASTRLESVREAGYVDAAIVAVTP